MTAGTTTEGRAGNRSPFAVVGRIAPVAGVVASVLAIAALAIVAGRWQWGRHETRAAAIEARAAGLAQPVVPVRSLLDPGALDLPPGTEWRRVAGIGAVEPDSVTVLRNRSVDGIRADEYLAWLDLEDGASVLVLLGWEPLARDDLPGPSLDDGAYRVEGILRRQESDDGRGGESATRIAAAQMPAPTAPPVPGYVYATEVCRTDGGCPPHPLLLPEPELGLGPHLAYAFQWYLLAALSPVGAVVLLRRRGGSAPVRGARPARRRAPSDEEVEDGLADASP